MTSTRRVPAFIDMQRARGERQNRKKSSAEAACTVCFNVRCDRPRVATSDLVNRHANRSARNFHVQAPLLCVLIFRRLHGEVRFMATLQTWPFGASALLVRSERLFQYVSDVPGSWNLYCYGALQGCAGTLMDLFVYWPFIAAKFGSTNGQSPVQIEGNSFPFAMLVSLFALPAYKCDCRK
jgi:hypothetical protein